MPRLELRSATFFLLAVAYLMARAELLDRPPRNAPLPEAEPPREPGWMPEAPSVAAFTAAQAAHGGRLTDQSP
jgi:hypothetical protein